MNLFQLEVSRFVSICFQAACICVGLPDLLSYVGQSHIGCYVDCLTLKNMNWYQSCYSTRNDLPSNTFRLIFSSVFLVA
jgi:hypothetical protein